MMLLLWLSGCQDEARSPADPSRDGRFGTATSHGPAGKDMTLLHGDPRLQTDSLPDRIRRLKREIARGESVYTRRELQLLERKLAECEEQYRVIQHP